MADLSTLADAVLANPAPVVLLDACTVLDIVRAAFPARPSSSDIIVDAKRLDMATVRLVFVSSNTEDFDVKQASLEAELRAHELKWLPDLHAAAGFAGVR